MAKLVLLVALGSVCLADAFLIRGVRVFDGEEVLGVQHVLVASGKIAAVAPQIAPPPNAVIIEAQGLTLLPGLSILMSILTKARTICELRRYLVSQM